MTSSSTATLPLPAATPHLRAVRSVPSPADRSPAGRSTAERWHGGAAPQRQAPAAADVAAVPAPPTVPAPSALHPAQAPQPPQALLAALPEGAAVVAALPPGVLPQALLAQYGAQFGAAAPGHPMVGYLVLVPAETGTPAGPAPAGAGAGGPAAVRPVRPAGRGITVDVERRNAYVDGRLLDLTYLEFELLAHLTEHPQRVHTRDHLVSAVWGYGHVGDGRTVDVHVARLRRKLGSAYRESIVTVRRVGYKYTPVA
ncbi:winged helix-turn-helix domain-containing protein [Kitasatospora sp. CM 4170]|uniref:Winged helix-turn-helix domain-containing protein n=1 Tax=Kitasatospora aburaviensis TaxID=67265 RepID=A0ABW1ERD2_9ACTN|nr:winged helix-turn-helix domain-containing protein [Kitasatospora sp. CM 4170]WNM48611.1 winged helix-turn-helix domain-containing protein [Kitasatospora sp. CM 4170]